MSPTLTLIVVSAGIVVGLILGFALMVKAFYRKVEQGKALIVNKLGKQPEVTFTGGSCCRSCTKPR
jgi:flotillin